MAKKTGSKANLEAEAQGMRTKLRSYWAELCVINILAVFPLFLADKYILLTGHKAKYLWITTFVLLAILVLAELMFMGTIKSKGKKGGLKTITVPDIAVTAYWLFVVLSAVFSDLGFTEEFSFFMQGYPERNDGILSITVYVILYFIASRMFRAKERDWSIFGVSACIVSILGILQFVGWDVFKLYPYGLESSTTPVAGIYPYNYLEAVFRTTLGNVDIISAYVAIAVCFFAVLFIREEKKIRWLYAATTVLSIGLMLTAGADGGKVGVLAGITLIIVLNLTDRKALSRLFLVMSPGFLLGVLEPLVYAARDHYRETGIEKVLYWGAGWYRSMYFLGAIACLIIGLGLHFIPVWFNVKRKGILALIAVAVIIVVAFAGIEFMGRLDTHLTPDDPAYFSNIVWQAREILHGNFEDMFGSGRAVLWKASVQELFYSPWLGHGPDAFEWALTEHQKHLYEVTNTTFDKAHNDYLQIAICNGFLGLAAFLLFIGALAVKVFPKVWDNPVLMAAAAAIGAYCVQAFFGISTPMVTPLFFVMMGIAACRDDHWSSAGG
ncbi:MAG: O-antigen ligase family protein [Oscillospiraceae bacterium]|nr:O-antigen ligase family protein [Oscillospiraceae bacterium]